MDPCSFLSHSCCILSIPEHLHFLTAQPHTAKAFLPARRFLTHFPSCYPGLLSMPVLYSFTVSLASAPLESCPALLLLLHAAASLCRPGWSCTCDSGSLSRKEECRSGHLRHSGLCRKVMHGLKLKFERLGEPGQLQGPATCSARVS